MPKIDMLKNTEKQEKQLTPFEKIIEDIKTSRTKFLICHELNELGKILNDPTATSDEIEVAEFNLQILVAAYESLGGIEA
jgi:hypothetical protein